MTCHPTAPWGNAKDKALDYTQNCNPHQSQWVPQTPTSKTWLTAIKAVILPFLTTAVLHPISSFLYCKLVLVFYNFWPFMYVSLVLEVFNHLTNHITLRSQCLKSDIFLIVNGACVLLSLSVAIPSYLTISLLRILCWYVSAPKFRLFRARLFLLLYHSNSHEN